MQSPKPATIAQAIEACREHLQESSASATPWLDARLLAQFVTGLDASAIVAYGDTVIERSQRTQLFALARRRASGEPVAYLVGKKHFCGLDIAVDKRVLVPRAETEELVIACVDDWSGKAPRIADVGTGSGAIACALAHLLPDAAIVASDINDDALELVAHNVNTLCFSDQITVVRSDLFAAYAPGAGLDVIIANLPYVAEDRIADMEANVRDHEPALALLGGPDGLSVYRRLLDEAPARLKDGGALYFECAPNNAALLRDLTAAAFPRAQVNVCKDVAGLERMVIARLKETGA